MIATPYNNREKLMKSRGYISHLTNHDEDQATNFVKETINPFSLVEREQNFMKDIKKQ